ncbi:MAG: aldehyde dehydrogenase family protein [Rhodobacter sp.]|nr:aldehyde dehydrogenase family protein [Rhodobacter sp.]
MNVPQLLARMDYGPAPESAAEAEKWLDDRERRFGHFINGVMTAPGEGFETRNPATAAKLATLTGATAGHVDAAVRAARAAQPKWAALSGHDRARYLYALTRLVQKHSRLLAVLETLDNGKPIRESRDIDIPLVARHFQFHAGMAQLQERELPEREPFGVCGQIIPWNFPLLMLAWKIAPAIAMGNTVVLKPAEYTSLSALLFADLCQQAGIPKGVVNIVTGDGPVGDMIVRHPDIDKIAFTGSTEVGRRIREATAGSGKGLTLELGGKSPYIVFDDADIDSAVEGLVDAIWFNQGQVCCAGSRLLLQESISERFHQKLKRRMAKLRVGNPLDKCVDIGAMVDPAQLRHVRDLLKSGGGEVFQPAISLPDGGCYFPPTLVTGLSQSDRLMQEEIFGPVLVSTTFRTPDEAVRLANNTRYGLAASVWSENANLALDVAPRIAAGVVWINAGNLFDAAAAFGGVRESGFGREGGWEGLSAYTRPKRRTKPLKRLGPYGKGGSVPSDRIDRTAKLYIGGRQTRPDSGYSSAVHSPRGRLIGHVGAANRKDIRNAVEAAGKASAWSRSTGHSRAQILFFVAENLSARAEEFTNRIRGLTGVSENTARAEVDTAVARLFTYAAWSDKFDGAARGVPLRGVVLSMREPVGIIGALCPDETPLLGTVSVMAPAISMGNRCVLVASEPFPLVATDFYQVLETSDIPDGVVNILTGSHSELAPHLAGHAGVDAVWSFSSTELSAIVEREAASNLKRTWVNDGRSRDWAGADGEGQEFLSAATDTKSVWIPYGE